MSSFDTFLRDLCDAVQRPRMKHVLHPNEYMIIMEFVERHKDALCTSRLSIFVKNHFEECLQMVHYFERVDGAKTDDSMEL